MAITRTERKELFFAMCDLFYGGAFSDWLSRQKMPLRAIEEFEKAEEYFAKITGFKSLKEIRLDAQGHYYSVPENES